MSQVTFAPQLLPEQMEAIKEKGFVSIINNRPDNEEANQPLQTDIQISAEASGLNYAFLPVVGGQMTQQNVEDFAEIYNKIEKPVLMFCRTGNRSSVLYQTAKQMDLLDED